MPLLWGLLRNSELEQMRDQAPIILNGFWLLRDKKYTEHMF